MKFASLIVIYSIVEKILLLFCFCFSESFYVNFIFRLKFLKFYRPRWTVDGGRQEWGAGALVACCSSINTRSREIRSLFVIYGTSFDIAVDYGENCENAKYDGR